MNICKPKLRAVATDLTNLSFFYKLTIFNNVVEIYDIHILSYLKQLCDRGDMYR